MPPTFVWVSTLVTSASPPPTLAPPQRCKVLEVAYSAVIGNKVPAYPSDVRPSWRLLTLENFTSDSPVRRMLSADEVDRLTSGATSTRTANYRPLCAAIETPSATIGKEGHRQFVSFTDPIVSSDGRLALVEVSFRETGIFGFGEICVVRWRRTRWRATCSLSWIS